MSTRIRRVLEYEDGGRIFSVSKWRWRNENCYGHFEPAYTLERWLETFSGDFRLKAVRILPTATKAERLAIQIAKLKTP